ncbi:MAG: hypothetical protein HZA04_02190 [Nitrospinae bacterium]|nr:hypothetical protein [Nitrospinota bacterium]
MPDENEEQPAIDVGPIQHAPPPKKSGGRKIAFVAALAALITVSAFLGSWMASKKSKEDAAKTKTVTPDEMGKSFKAILEDPHGRERSIDEMLEGVDFSDPESRVKGNTLLAKKMELNAGKTKDKLDEESTEAEKQRRLEKSLGNWIKRTD